MSLCSPLCLHSISRSYFFLFFFFIQPQCLLLLSRSRRLFSEILRSIFFYSSLICFSSRIQHGQPAVSLQDCCKFQISSSIRINICQFTQFHGRKFPACWSPLMISICLDKRMHWETPHKNSLSPPKIF